MQLSNDLPASNAIDGISSTCSKTTQTSDPWFALESVHHFTVISVAITSQTANKLNSAQVAVGHNKPSGNKRNKLCYTINSIQAGETVSSPCESKLSGKYVEVRLFGSHVVSVCEIVVYGERLSGECLCHVFPDIF